MVLCTNSNDILHWQKYKAVYKKFGHQQFERIAQLPCVQQLTVGEPAAEL